MISALQIKNKKNCTGCSLCASICKANAITMSLDKEGFLYPEINDSVCINCGACVKFCPVLKFPKKLAKLNKTNMQAYAVINKDIAVRLNSSSGGVFFALASEVIKSQGVVFGAKFDSDFSVCHGFATNQQELKELTTSKYLQSRIENSFVKAKEFLEQGKLVLFTGTPCQTAGLTAFLNKDYSNLIIQDFICHGVPSPKIWQEHLAKIRKPFKGKILKINFRDKSLGWKNYCVSVEFSDGKYLKSHSKDKFIQAFLRNRILRPSCYSCNFKGNNRFSDITLADFWGGGYKKYLSEGCDNKGVSLLILNTKKGEELLQKIKPLIKLSPVPMKSSLRFNPSYFKSSFKNPLRIFSFKNKNPQ